MIPIPSPDPKINRKELYTEMFETGVRNAESHGYFLVSEFNVQLDS